MTPTGSITASTNGQTISGKDVNGTISVNANNVTITDTRVTTSGFAAINICSDCTGTTVTYSTIRGTGTTDSTSLEAAIYGQVALVDHDWLYNCQDCMEQSSGAVVKDSYLLVNGSSPDAHYEDIYVNMEYGGIDVEHSTLFNIFPQTAVVFGDNTNRSYFTVKNSLLGGGDLMFYADHFAGTVDIENNHFVRCRTTPFVTNVYGNGGHTCSGGGTDPDQGQTPDGHGYYPNGGYFGVDDLSSCSGPGLIWSGNVWDDNGAPVSCS